MKSIQDIRVIQLIDSLEVGGAERMAVTIANTLANRVAFSGIIVTRLEGELMKTLNSNVKYLYLQKNKTLDFVALLRFRKFVVENKVTIIHAHGSSYFFAILLKFTFPSIKVFWHDHFGNRLQNNISNKMIQLASFFFRGVFTVNLELRDWALKNLKTTNIVFLPNYVEENTIVNKNTFLKGIKDKRIVLLANLRAPKNHMLALESFSKSGIAKLGWTLHFIGKDNFDDYSSKLKSKIINENLSQFVFLYGSCIDIPHILSQANVGLLTSTYEGFPVTLLEYGKANLMVITSNVGYCNQIIKNEDTGVCFESGNEKELMTLFKNLENNSERNIFLASNSNTFVAHNYSAKVVIEKLLTVYEQ